MKDTVTPSNVLNPWRKKLTNQRKELRRLNAALRCLSDQRKVRDAERRMLACELDEVYTRFRVLENKAFTAQAKAFALGLPCGFLLCAFVVWLKS